MLAFDRLCFVSIKLLGVLAVISVVFLIAPSAIAATIYINSSTGDDVGGDGSAGNPYKTFHKGYTESSAGDTLDLTGTFDWSDAAETGDSVTSGYTISKSLTIQGQAASSTFIQASSSKYTADRRVFTVSGTGVSVTMRDLGIRYGHYSSDSGAAGVYMTSNASLTMINTIVTENANTGRFGDSALRVDGSGSFILRNSAVYNNDGIAARAATSASWPGYTGGLRVGNTGGTEVTNSTFFGNTASYNGGIYQSHSSSVLTLTNNTFANNRGDVTSHSYMLWSGTLYVKNNIFAERPNTAEVDFGYNSGTVNDGGNNIVETQVGGIFTNGVNGNLVGDQVNLGLDLELLANDATTTVPTLALASTSVAINAGTTTAHNSINVPDYDQRYGARVGLPDIGAYEYGSPIDGGGSGGSSGGGGKRLALPPKPSVYVIVEGNQEAMVKGSYFDEGIVTDSVGFFYWIDDESDREEVLYKRGVINFRHQLKNLECGTTYSIQAFAENSVGFSYSDLVTFTTEDCLEVPGEQEEGSGDEEDSAEEIIMEETNENDESALLQIRLNELTRQLEELLALKVSLSVVEEEDVMTAVGDMPMRDLSVGDEGEDVVWLQEFLINAKVGPSAGELARVGATGLFSTYTANALSEYQRVRGILPPNGYYGALTRAYILSAR